MKKISMFMLTLIANVLVMNNTFSAGVRITNSTPHTIAVTIKAFGLVFAADLPRIAFLSPKESFLFDAGLGGIETITASFCDKIVSFDLSLAGTTEIRNCVLNYVNDDLFLDVDKTAILPPLGKFKGTVIKSSKRTCLCLPQKSSQ